MIQKNDNKEYRKSQQVNKDIREKIEKSLLDSLKKAKNNTKSYGKSR